MQITVSSNLAAASNEVLQWGKQVKYAETVSLTKTAGDVRSGLKNEIQKVFNRPTPYTLNSLRVQPATIANPVAFVWLKDEAGKGTPADKYLAPQINGGSRSLKRFEQALQAAGVMPRGQFAVPAAGAQLDAYGNVKRSQIIQILSQLRAQRTGGFESRRSNNAASKRTVARQGVTYFSVFGQNNRAHLKPGIYLKKQFAHGSAIKPVFIYTTSVNYRQIFKFFEIGEKIAAKRFPEIFDEELKKSITRSVIKQQGLV